MNHTQSTTTSGKSAAELSMLNIDCANPGRQAEFYATALGWTVTYSDENYGMLEGNGLRIGFGKMDGYQPAPWPDDNNGKRFHLDMRVDDLDEAAANLCAIGATKPDFQPGDGRWLVLLDPDGQPFCLSPRSA